MAAESIIGQQHLAQQLAEVTSNQSHIAQQLADVMAGLQHVQQLLDVHATRMEVMERGLSCKAERSDVVGLVTTLTRSSTVTVKPPNWDEMQQDPQHASSPADRAVLTTDINALPSTPGCEAANTDDSTVSPKAANLEANTACSPAEVAVVPSQAASSSSLHRTVSQLVAASSAQAAQVAALQGLLAMLDKQMAGAWDTIGL